MPISRIIFHYIVRLKLMEHNFFQISKYNQATFFHNGKSYREEYLRLIQNAKKSIHLQTYIFMMDSFGKLVHGELIKASKRGVKVYLIVDSVGSRLLNHKSEKELIDSGINFLRFNRIQLKWLYSWGRRLHHKILLIDEQESFVGGINVLASEISASAAPQLDFAIFLKGPVIARLTQYCQMIFKKTSLKKIHFSPITELPPIPGGVELKIMINDWVYRRWQITRQYNHLT